MYGIFTYIYHKNQPNVGKYTSPMDPMGTADGNYALEMYRFPCPHSFRGKFFPNGAGTIELTVLGKANFWAFFGEGAIQKVKYIHSRKVTAGYPK